MDIKIVAISLIIGLLIGVGIGYAITGQAPATEGIELTGTIVVKGSDTLLVVAQR